MKKIEAIIRPNKVEEVMCALHDAGCPGVMITEIEGQGKQKGLVQQWRGKKYKVSFLPKTKIEVVVDDKTAKKIVSAITEAAYTGEIGDGKIFVYNIENVIRIRTKEEGSEAV